MKDNQKLKFWLFFYAVNYSNMLTSLILCNNKIKKSQQIMTKYDIIIYFFCIYGIIENVNL